MGIITTVEQPAKWVNPAIVVRKPNGDVRICLDPVDLNKAVKREHYPLKTVEEVAASMSEAKVFSTPDATSNSTRSRWPKNALGLLRSTHSLADLNLRGCYLAWYQPQRFFKGPCPRCLRTLRNVKLLLKIF